VIFLDTTVVSAVLRRRRRGASEQRLAERVESLLLTDAPVVLPGIVLQEVLSGISAPEQFRRVRDAIHTSFPVVVASEADHVAAAELVNAAARRGVSCSTPDALIAAQVVRARGSLFTTDGDFARLAGVARLEIFS
jgi:hypothetical protein